MAGNSDDSCRLSEGRVCKHSESSIESCRLSSTAGNGGDYGSGSGSGTSRLSDSWACKLRGQVQGGSVTSGEAAPSETCGAESGPSVAAAEKQGKRATAAADPTFLSPKEKEGALVAAARTMMQQARRLAATARAVVVDNVFWRQTR